MKRSLLFAAFVVVLSVTVACTGKKDTPGVVGNQYPHEPLDVTGSPYQANTRLENIQGVNRDTEKVRGPSLELAKPTETTPTTETPTTTETTTEGGVQNTVEKTGDTTQGGTTK